MKRLPLLLLMLAAGVFLTVRTMGSGNSTPPSRYERILQSIHVILTQGHYKPKDINDDFSKKVFKKFLEELDGDKSILLQEDIAALRKYETKIDDEIKGKPVEFFLEASKIFNRRVDEASRVYKDILAQPFDFTKDESIVTNRKLIDFPANQAALRETWRKKLKYMTLDRFVELQNIREKSKGDSGFVVKSDAELEKEARQKVTQIMDRTFDRYKYKFSEDDKFNLFVNAITNTMDPYTEFMPPVDKRYFDEQLSGRFSGIGASLVYDEGNIKIASVLAGSPAFKSQQVEVGDIITKVAQGRDSAVELTGYVVEDAVKIIRGKKGSEVTLTLKKKDGTLKNVTLIRDEIIQDEVFARSAVIDNGTSKVGYIFLPEFYADFENPNGARSAVDVAKEVIKLKAEKVDGIVIDLRNNGGGSLYDVVQMVGLFIEEGPIVQVKDREGNPMVLRDKDKSVLYNGPLAVLVNEFSASASEIFAAAIQDYGRGIVLGSSSTFGKGTVQRAYGLDPESNFMSSNSDLGSIKLTLQKFYRINGGSTQLKGVVPDVVIPDRYEYLEYREKHNEDAMPWDEINNATYNKWASPINLQTVKAMSATRIASNPAFKTIQESTDFLSQQTNKPIPLHIDKYKAEQKKIREVVARMDSVLKLDKDLNMAFLQQDLQRISADKDKEARYKQWLSSLSKDIYLDQAVKTINDMVNQQNLVRKDQPVKSF